MKKLKKNLTKTNKPVEYDNESHVHVNMFTNATGLELVKELAKWISIGSFMGISDAIPGYSGGTTLALVGAFDRLVLTAKSIFKPEPGVSRIKAFLWMMPFALGWIAGVFGFAKLTEYLVENNFGLELVFAFSFFVIFAIPTFLKSENPSLFKDKDEPDKPLVRGVRKRWILVVVGFLIVLGLALWTFYKGGIRWSPRAEINPDGGASLTPARSVVYALTFKNISLLVITAIFAGAITIIPGGSGAIVQLLFDRYKDIHWTIMAHAFDNKIALAIFAFSTLVGMMIAIFSLSWLLTHKRAFLAALSFGMLLGSVIAIFLVPEPIIWKNITETKHIVGILFSVMIAIESAILIHYRTRGKVAVNRLNVKIEKLKKENEKLIKRK